MSNDNSLTYSHLEPTLILDAIESLGFICDGNLLALNSYENRVYQIGIQDESPFIAKFYRPGRWSNETILEEHQFALELQTHEIPVVAPWMNSSEQTLHFFQEFRFALFPRWRGRALELDSIAQLEWMGRFLGRVHAIGATKSFQYRPTLNVENYGNEAYQILLDKQLIPAYLNDNFCLATETLLKLLSQHFLAVDNFNTIRLHGDLHAGNVLWNDAGPHIVDLDDCLMGPAIQDLWMLLSGDEQQVAHQLKHILKGYGQFFDFNRAELNLIEALRTLRMLHHMGWIAKRWEDPTFPLNFPWFNTPSYWEEQLRNFNEQIALLSQ